MMRKLFAVFSGTLASRILGFLRDLLFAFYFGTGGAADAYFVAFRIPNFFRRLLAEGALGNAFVPLFSIKHKNGEHDEAVSFASSIAYYLFILVGLLCLVFELFMPLIVWLIAPGFNSDPQQVKAAVDIARIMMPYLVCMSMAGIVSGMLNGMGKFAMSSYAPISLNVVLISIISWYGYYKGLQEYKLIYYMAGGVFFAGLLHLLLVVMSLRRLGVKLKPRHNLGELKLFLGKFIPGLIAAGTVQINLIIGTVIASTIPGAVSVLYYTDRLYQLPLALTGIALSTVMLPRLSALDQLDIVNLRREIVEFSLFLIIPVMAGLAYLAFPIIQIVFERAAFTSTDTSRTALCTFIFSFGLPWFMLGRVFSTFYFAKGDTKSPLFFSLLSSVVNTILAITLSRVWAENGIAIATVFASFCSVFAMLIHMKVAKIWTPSQLFCLNLGKIVFATSLMVAYLFIADAYFEQHDSLLQNLIWLFLLGIGGALVYFTASYQIGLLGSYRNIFAGK